MNVGFPDRVVSLIMTCVTQAFLSIIWNGRSLPTFSPTRGLRLGDPFSLYLFVLCMEKLSLLINKKVSDRSWKIVKVLKDGPGYSHLLFADDVVFFSQAIRNRARIIQGIVNHFYSYVGIM